VTLSRRNHLLPRGQSGKKVSQGKGKLETMRDTFAETFSAMSDRQEEGVVTSDVEEVTSLSPAKMRLDKTH